MCAVCFEIWGLLYITAARGVYRRTERNPTAQTHSQEWQQKEQKYSVGLELFAKHVRDTGFVSALSSLNWLQIVLKYFAKNLFI